jgi:hypothetical protein
MKLPYFLDRQCVTYGSVTDPDSYPYVSFTDPDLFL